MPNNQSPHNRRPAGLLASLIALLAGLIVLYFVMQSHPAGLGLAGVLFIALAFFALGCLPSYMLLRRNSQSLTRLVELAKDVASGRPGTLGRSPDVEPYGDLLRALHDSAELHEQTSRQLRDERNRIDLILRRMVEGVAVIETGNKIVFCNEAFAQALGLGGLPRAGKLLVEVTRESGLLDLVQRVRETGEVIRTEIETGLAQRKTFDVTGAPIPTDAAPSVVLVLHDVSEIRRLEQMRRDFVANVSHEFKTPLTAIQGFAETLIEGAIADKQNGPRFLQIIKDHAIRLNRLTTDLLRLSQIEAGQVVILKEKLPLRETLQVCVDTVRMKSEKKNIALSTDLPPGEAFALADPARLREILLNLLDNAIQYTPAGGKIVLGAKPSPEGVTFYVADTGIGIPVAEQQRIFERFYRVDDARSRDVGGTGLGLAITRHLVEAHGGTISLSSTVNQGATFSAFIPSLPAEKTSGNN